MNRPDDKTLKMLEGELNRIMDDVTGNSPIAEQNLVTLLILEVTINTASLPAGVRHKTFEILSRYYALIEGLEKK